QISTEIHFNNCTFSDDIKFNHCEFTKSCGFSKCNFQGLAHFTSAKFRGTTSFRENVFVGKALFHKSVFDESCTFGKSVFKSDCFFGGAKFNAGINFDESLFEKTVDFEKVIFNSDVTFRAFNENTAETGFKSNVYFTYTAFLGRVEFNNWDFEYVTFLRANFDKEAVFEKVDLCNTSFHFVDLDKNIYFYNVKWRKIKNRFLFNEEEGKFIYGEVSDKISNIQQALKHYNELVSYYDKKRDVKTSELFYVSEMTARFKIANWYEKPIFIIYLCASRYGTSWPRAFVLLLLVLFIICPSIFIISEINSITNMVKFISSVKTSLIYSFQALLLHKALYINVTPHEFFVRVFCQLLLLGQTALLLLAIRRNLRRSAPSS
ncbi:MAG: pentapeptide repeat-containing protein, partial [Saprospiraceae bacterium]|nr:pentapeptide repeat-containing protein [Saprospiraceae bacterium]